MLEQSRITGDIAQGSEGVFSWRFAPVSPECQYSVDYVLKRWNDLKWLNDPANRDPLAAIIAAFHNRKRLLDLIKKGAGMVSIRQGDRWVLIPENASVRVQALAKNHLKGY